MTTKNSIVIRTSYFGTSWIPLFITEIEKAGGNADRIHYVDHYAKTVTSEEAKRRMEYEEEHASHIVELLLHPAEHKNYVLAIAQLFEKFQDPRVLLVYDFQRIPDAPQLSRPLSNIVSITHLEAVLRYLRKPPNAHRVISRAAAVIVLGAILTQ